MVDCQRGQASPQRNLAFDLKVTIGTIGRAYALAHERGLVTGEVGRGTYVLGEEPADNALSASGIAGTKPADVPSGKIRFDTTAAPDVGQHEVLAKINAEIHRDFPQDIASYSRYFPQHWLEAGQNGFHALTGGQTSTTLSSPMARRLQASPSLRLSPIRAIASCSRI